jgi:uncharacterized protein YndB with AHSA1/START domain
MHTASAEPGLQVHFEPRVGGRVYERTPSGAEHEWGEILAWEPPHRLVYRWHLNQDRSDASEVEIAFVSTPDDGTRVDIEHRGWDRLGRRGRVLRRRNVAGWDGVLPSYIAAAEA